MFIFCSNVTVFIFSSSIEATYVHTTSVDKSNMLYFITEMSESDLLATDHIDGLDGLENGQDGDAIMQCDGVKRELNEANIDDPVLCLF